MAVSVTKKRLGVVMGGTVLSLILFWKWNFPVEERQFGHFLDIFDFSDKATDESPVGKHLYRNIFDPSKEPPLLIGSESTTQKDNYLIYRCDNSLMPCGGYSDRIKGAMTAYMIANLTGRTFKMQLYVGECDFHNFLVPNKVDWYLPQPFHQSVKASVKAGNASLLKLIDRDLTSRVKDKDFLTLRGMESKYFYFLGNRDSTRIFQASLRYKQQLSWMSHLKYSEMNEAIYKHLFKPSQYLQDKLTKFFEEHLQPRDNLMCAHVRFARNPTLPADTPTRIKSEHLPNLWNFLNEKSKRKANVKIFIMTDNEEIVTEVKRRQSDAIFVSPGPIVHVDRYSSKIPPEKVCEGFEKVIFDQLVLMHCDLLVVGRSGLSQMAAYVRGTDDDLYCFGPTGKVLPCKRNEIRMVFY